MRTEVNDEYINDIRKALEAMADAIRDEQLEAGSGS